MIITIDGPSASGKSCVAQIIANKLDIYYLYSGMLYRALAYILVNFGSIKVENLSIINKDDILKYSIDLKYCYSSECGAEAFFNNTNITHFLKDAVVDSYVSIFSTNPSAREVVLNLQRSIAKSNSLIADGRDGGTIVFPNADFKFFLTARSEVRALRWQSNQKSLGNIFSESESLNRILSRDHQDQSRSIAPLKQSPDAIFIDNSDISLEETVDLMMRYINSANSKSKLVF